MQNIMLSNAEKLFRIQGSQVENNLSDIRLSNRGFCSFRPISIELGFNKSEVNAGDTRVLVNINFEPDGKPLPRNPREGYIKFKIDLSPTIITKMSNRKADQYCEYVKSLLIEAYNDSNIINLSDLCITPFKKCWIIYIDILVTESDGNILDIISLAINSALRNTSIPKINTVDVSREIHFNMDNCPIYVTVNKIDCKYLIDADQEEETCSAIRTMTAVLPNGVIKGTSIDGEGCVKRTSLLEMLKISSVVGIEMHKSLVEYAHLDAAINENYVDNVL